MRLSCVETANNWEVIKNFPNYLISPDGRLWSQSFNKPISQMIITKKGTQVLLRRTELKQLTVKHTLYVHDLVLSTFVGNPPSGYVAIHKNGNNCDNRISNLVWGFPVPNVNPAEWKEIYNFSGYWINKQGKIWSTRRNVFLTPAKQTGGMRQVHIYRNKIKYDKLVHHLVLETFVCPRPKDKECNHKDGDKSNNNLENLEWVTHSENAQHAWDTGLWNKEKRNFAKGIRNARAILNEEQVLEIRKKHSLGRRYCELAREFKVDDETIRKICIRENWTWLE